MLVRTTLSEVYKEVDVTLSTDQYADADVLFDTTEIADILPMDSPFIWQSVVLLDKSDQAAALDLLILRSNSSVGTANAALSVADSVADEIVGVVEIAAADYVDLANSQMVQKDGIGVVGKTESTDTSLYVAGVSRGTGTYAAAGITLKFGFLVDISPDVV